VAALRTLLALSVALVASFACAQPQIGHGKSLEALVLGSDVVAVATLESYALTADARAITAATFSIDDAIKGSIAGEVTVEVQRAPRTFLDWIEGSSRFLLFRRKGELSVEPISGPLPQIIRADLTTLKDPDAIVRAARMIALTEEGSGPVATVSVQVPWKLIEGWRGTGTVYYLEIPITQELHRWAVEGVRSSDPSDRGTAAAVFAHFRTEEDIALLKTLLTDTAVAHCDQPSGNLGKGRGIYWVREAAYNLLTEIGAKVERPEIEFTSFEPDEVRFVYLEREPNARETIKTLRQFKNLGALYLANTRMTDDDVRYVSALPGITELHAASNPLSDVALVEIGKMTSLKTLDLGRTKVTDAGLASLSRLQSLEYLDLSGTQITNAGLYEVARLKRLKWINVANTKVTPEGLRALNRLEHLDSINNIVVDWQETDAYLLTLRDAGLLHAHDNARAGDGRATRDDLVTSFSVYGAPIGDAALEVLTGFVNLEELSISRAKVTDAGLSKLKKFGRLRRLVLNDSQITNSGLQTVSQIGGLTSLGIANTSVGDDGMFYVGKLQDLEWLAISGTQVTDSGFFHLRSLKKLKHLVMHNLPITDAAISHILELTSLEGIMLGRTQVTEPGLLQLAKIKSLKTLSVNNSDGRLSPAIAKLHRLRPDIEIS
jgi:Leucine-rich repeat (LRR) protein